jgi:hypothetical protein
VSKKHRITVAMVALILVLCASTVLAQEQRRGPPPVQALANNGYLYVLVGQSIHQYLLPDMSFQKTVTLPGGLDFKPSDADVQKPPMLSFLIDGEYLYVLGARYMYQYSLPELDLEVTQSLPKPANLQ